ncbi:MAG: serine/threonine-protein kinase [Clostridiales bacterium]|nr:serine/threonine-protein kinase [Clostridiales bacterium]
MCGSIQNAPNLLANGTIISGRYVIGNSLRETDTVTEYISYDSVEKHRVVVKECYPRLLATRNKNGSLYVSDEEMGTAYKKFMQYFVQKMQGVSALGGETGTIRIKNAFYENETAYFVVSETEGISVSEYISHGSVMNTSAVLNVMRSLIQAILSLHTCGVIHGNISADTVYIVGNNVVLDGFELSSESIPALLRDSVPVKANAEYLPASAYGTGKHKPELDIFSAGAIAYTLLTGKKPSSAFENRKQLDADLLKRNCTDGEFAKVIENMCAQGVYTYENIEAVISDMNPIFQNNGIDIIALPAVKNKGKPNGTQQVAENNKNGNGLKILLAVIVLLAVALCVFFGIKHFKGKKGDSIAVDESSASTTVKTDAGSDQTPESETTTSGTEDVTTLPNIDLPTENDSDVDITLFDSTKPSISISKDESQNS